jgi:hypothetical protein
MSRIQELTDEANMHYWRAVHTSDPEDWMWAALTGRQLIVEMGREKMIHDKLLDSECKDEISKWAKEKIVHA